MPTLRVALLSLGCLILAGCTRGCGPDAEPCDDNGDCDAPNTCYRGYCSGPGYIAFDRRCRSEPPCREQGKCGAMTVRSFLGANTNLECAAVDEADCRVAEVCPASGLCSLYDGWCVAQTDEHCAASRRCRTHDECSAHSFECVRRWPECDTPLAPPAHAPAWANPTPLHHSVDMQRMRGPWQPGAVEAARLACEARLTSRGHSRLRVGDRCTSGPHVDDDAATTFLLSNVRLRPGDELAMAVQWDWDTGRASRDSFVKATYTGTSPFQGGLAGETVICHVVPPDVARAMAQEALGVADLELATARLQRPRGFETQYLGRIHDALSDAAAWIEWDDPDITARIQRMTALERTWAEQLAPLLRKRQRTATPPRTLVTSAGELSLQVVGHVCGARLTARREHPVRPPADDACALELRIQHIGDGPYYYNTTSVVGIGNLGELAWGHVSGGLGEVVDVELVDIHFDAPGAKPERSGELAPGKSAVILLGGKQRDLPLANQTQDDFTLLTGRVAFGDSFTLRTELTPDPAPAKKRPRRN